MKKLIGSLIIAVVLVGGLYLSLWICLVGGIIQIVEACKVDPIEAMGIGLGVLRLVLTSLALIVTVILTGVIGAATFGSRSRAGLRL